MSLKFKAFLFLQGHKPLASSPECLRASGLSLTRNSSHPHSNSCVCEGFYSFPAFARKLVGRSDGICLNSIDLTLVLNQIPGPKHKLQLQRLQFHKHQQNGDNL